MFRRRLPYLVWAGDEIDVVVVLKEAKLPEIKASTPEEAINAATACFKGSPFNSIEDGLAAAGIRFDKSVDGDGRSWEWDWSLHGPISVRFLHRAVEPENRLERPRPHLVVSNDNGAA
jgi:hypothetical protein